MILIFFFEAKKLSKDIKNLNDFVSNDKKEVTISV